MDENPDLGAVAQGSGALVEPEGPLDLALLVSAATALGQDVREVELRRLAFAPDRGTASRAVGRASLGPSAGRFRAPTVNLLPCMDRSGMRAPGGCTGRSPVPSSRSRL